MKRPDTITTLALSFGLLFIHALNHFQGYAAKLNNVIVIMADDMTPFHLDPQHPVKMPNLERLAERGIKFVNAHTSFPVCGPSRVSLMTGRYADSTKIFHFERYIFQVPGLETMAQYLHRRFGFETVAFGKVFHEDYDPNNPIARGMFDSGLWTQRQQGGGSGDAECRARWYCIKQEQNSGDWQLSRRFVTFLSNRNTTKPLLAFLGFRKPHLDLGVPAKYVKENLSDVEYLLTDEPPSFGNDQTIIPFRSSLQRFECHYELAKRKINRVSAIPPGKFLQAPYQNLLVNIRRHYFAAMAFHDDLVGYVLNYIDNDSRYADSTAIVHFSDHGFAMGEHGMFCKNALFDQQTRVPLVISPAKQQRARYNQGQVRSDPVNLVDIFPTVVELASGEVLPISATVDNSGIPIDGTSLLRNKESLYSFSQYPRCANVSSKSGWQCVNSVTQCGRLPNKYMGYAVRTLNKKYIEWRPFSDVSSGCSKPTWHGISKKVYSSLKKVKQMNTNKTGTKWDNLPVQMEYFTDYQDRAPLRWGFWERKNILINAANEPKVVTEALELSAAIRWRFDPSFSPVSPQQPCSGHGVIRLKNRGKWRDFTKQPGFNDIYCECLSPWHGPLCQHRQS